MQKKQTNTILDQSLIEFKFPTVRSKLQSLFPFDPKYDIQIIFRNNKYELQTAYLRLQSGFFKNFNSNVSKVIRIEEDFNEEYFQEIMKCFYGGTFKCIRTGVFQVWKILQYLKIQAFKKQIIKDMKHNFEKYNFFQLMTFGFMNNVEDVFNNCLIILDNQNFVQLKKNKNQFLSCSLQVFRFLINTHNRRPTNKRALNFIQINKILAQYSQKHEYSQEFYKDLKFQLIEKTELTAEEYRLIFIQGGKAQSTREIAVSQLNFSKKGSKTNPDPILAQSAQIFSNKSLTSEEKQHWQKKLQTLKSQFQQSQKDFKFLQNSADNLSKSLKRKSQESKQKQKTMAKMQTLVRQIQKQISDKTQSIKKISQRVQKLQNSTGKGNKGKSQKQLPPEQQQKDEFVQSHIIPGFVLGDIISQAQSKNKQVKQSRQPVPIINVKGPVPITSNYLNPPPQTNNSSGNFTPTASTANFSKKKKAIYEASQPKSPIQQPNSQAYKSCLLFDKQPISVPKRYLDSLAKILDTDQFVKKKQLSLIFRRSKISNNNVGDPAAIKNRQALLVLFQTSHRKYVGGYISVEIPSWTKSQTLCDYQAFIFSLTHNVKMPIMKGQQKSAISLSKHYLLSFANDLMISSDCLNQVSYCQWPGIYQVPKNSKCTSAKDLIGANGQFRIQQIDIYEVKNQEIEMVL